MDIAALDQKLDALAASYLPTERLPCLSFALIKRNDVVLRKELGGPQQPIEAGLAEREEPAFMMMSCTKVVTAVAALQLLEQGLWSLEDPVSKFLPKFADLPGVLSQDATVEDPGELEALASPLTMRMLLTHTSGLSYDILSTLTDGRPNPVAATYAAVNAAPSLRAQADLIAGYPLVAQPGTTWNYSMGVDVMGACIEVMSGMEIDEYFSTHIFEPLGMASTAFVQRLSPELKARRKPQAIATTTRVPANRFQDTRLPRLTKAVWYSPNLLSSYASRASVRLLVITEVKCFNVNLPAVMRLGKGFFAPDFDGPKMVERQGMHFGAALAPGGGLVSTLSDWVAFTQMLLGSGVGANGARLLKKSSVGLMASDQIPESNRGPNMKLINGTADDDAVYTQGLGVAVGTGSVKSFEWGGMTSTVFWIDRETGVGCVCLTQLMPSVIYPLRSQLKALVYPQEGKL